MRNSSDIFCLKEPKLGENDGTLIFSVKGSSSLKINRRHNASSDVFQYGRPEIGESTPETPILEQDEAEAALKAADLDIEKEKDLEKPVSPTNMRRNTITGDGVEPSSPSASISKHEPPPGDSADVSAGVEASSAEADDSRVSSSNMTRNPLTGVGMEDNSQRVSSRKRYQEKPDKWLW